MVTSIALDYWDTQLLPGVSAHTYLISFREETEYNGFNNSLSISEIRERINASNAIQSPGNVDFSGDRCLLIREYNVRFIVAQHDNVGQYKNVISKCEFVVEDVLSTKDLTLLKIK